MLAAFRRCSRFRRSTGVAPASVAAGCAADDEGFSLVELLIAMGITVSILGAAFTVVGKWQIGFGADNERVDQQQRLRVAVDAISRDLALAGAGPHVGIAAGPLGFAVASVFPFRQGALFPDVPGTARTDTLTVLYVLPQTAAQTTVRQPVAARSGTVFINHDAGCPPSDAACGFGVGTDVMVYDDTGSYDTFRVTAVQTGALELQHNMLDTAGIYAAGARIVEAASHTYSLKTDPRTGTVQLVRYDGVSSEAAVVDHLVGLAFDYFGDPAPPLLIRPVTEPVGPWTSYGPKPPRLNVRSTALRRGRELRLSSRCRVRTSGGAASPARRRVDDAGKTDRGGAHGRSLVSGRHEPAPIRCGSSENQASVGDAACGGFALRIPRTRRYPVRTRRQLALRDWVGGGSGDSVRYRASEPHGEPLIDVNGRFRTERWTPDVLGKMTIREPMTGELSPAGNWRADGVVLVAVLLLTLLISALGAALVLVSSSEMAVAANFRNSQEARYATVAAAARAVADLRDTAEWSRLLDGTVRSTSVDGPPFGKRSLPDGSTLDLEQSVNLANCQKTTACDESEIEAATSDRPWGANNPRWRLFSYGWLRGVLPAGAVDSGYYTVVLVGDDPSEIDGDPTRDGVPPNPGAGVIELRVQAFGMHGARRTINLTVGRASAGDPRVISWREIS